MSSIKHPRGYFKYLLAADAETSGLCFGSDNPVSNPKTGEHYQAVSFGLIVVDAETFQPVEDLYVEIQWNGKSNWTAGAEKIHGLSKDYLAKNGLTQEEAVVAIAELVLKYWGADGTISLIGQNVATFDLHFLRDLVRSQGIEFKFGNRHTDTHGLGHTVFGTYNSDDLFELVGVVRKDHNSLEDAYASLKVVQVVRAMSDSFK